MFANSSLDKSTAVDGRLLKIGMVYFALFLAHSIWRTTLHNQAVNNFELSQAQFGYVISATYIPGIFAFTIGLVAHRLPLYSLLVVSCLALAGGMFIFAATDIVTATDQFLLLLVATLLIAFGFTSFYTVANSACLLGSDGARAPYDLGRLKSLGPLAGFLAASIVIAMFAPASLGEWLSVIDLSDLARSIARLLSFSQSKPEVDSLQLHTLLVTLAFLLLLLGIYVGAAIRVSHAGRSLGRFNLRRGLAYYYALNFLAGCRSAIFQTFALFVMVKQYQLPISGTAILVMVAHVFGFLGYRWVGRMLCRFRHRHVLTLIYAVVAVNFVGFWWLNSGSFESTQFVLFGLGALFLIDSFFFGASVVTDSHLKISSEPRDFIGDIGVGMSMFFFAAWLMSTLCSILWVPKRDNAVDPVSLEPLPLDPDLFLLGSVVCLVAIVVAQLTLNRQPGSQFAADTSPR